MKNGAVGVESYSEASIGASNNAYTKIIPQKKSRDDDITTLSCKAHMR